MERDGVHIDEDLEALNYDELDELGRRITDQIRDAYQYGQFEKIDPLLAAKDRINHLKAQL
jgi:Txe/YoeB family toxin of Txe-Axe toxin-antitoxin module